MRWEFVMLFLYQLTSSFADKNDVIDELPKNIGQDYGYDVFRINEKSDNKLQPFIVTAEGFNQEHAYVISMFTKAGRSDPHGWNIHVLWGLTTSNDETRLAATYAIKMSQKFGKDAMLYREVHGHESPLFKSYFPDVYHPNEHDLTDVKRLYQVERQSKYISSHQVPLHVSYLNRDDCFVLDTGFQSNIFVYLGMKANTDEKTTAENFAKSMRACETHGQQGKIFKFDNFNEDSDIVEAFFNNLGILLENRNQIGGTTETKIDFQKKFQDDGCSFEFYNNKGKTQEKEWTFQGQVSRAKMSPRKCYVKDTESELGILVKFGKQTRVEERVAAFMKAEEIIRKKSYNLWTTVNLA